MKNRTKILIGIFLFIIILTATYTIIFCIKGTYPTEIYLALIPPTITEFFILYKIKKDDNENDKRV